MASDHTQHGHCRACPDPFWRVFSNLVALPARGQHQSVTTLGWLLWPEEWEAPESS